MLFRSPATHAGITAFSDSACEVSPGEDVTCDSSCFAFSGRRSFIASAVAILFDVRTLTRYCVSQVDGGSGPHCVTVFVDGNCPVMGTQFAIIGQEGQCTNFDGITLNFVSANCSPSNDCDF